MAAYSLTSYYKREPTRLTMSRSGCRHSLAPRSQSLPVPKAKVYSRFFTTNGLGLSLNFYKWNPIVCCVYSSPSGFLLNVMFLRFICVMAIHSFSAFFFFFSILLHDCNTVYPFGLWPRVLLGTSFVQTSLGAYEYPFLLGSVVCLKGGLLSSAFVGVTQQLFKEIALRFQTDFQRDVNSTSRDKCSACFTRLTALGTASLLHAIWWL